MTLTVIFLQKKVIICQNEYRKCEISTITQRSYVLAFECVHQLLGGDVKDVDDAINGAACHIPAVRALQMTQA